MEEKNSTINLLANSRSTNLRWTLRIKNNFNLNITPDSPIPNISKSRMNNDSKEIDVDIAHQEEI